MNLTGKCKEDFEKWAIDNNILDMSLGILVVRNGVVLTSFYKYSNSMQYGVYVDFFDENDLKIEMQVHVEPTMQGSFFKKFKVVILNKGRFVNVSNASFIRSRMRTAAIEKANEIYNSK
jgi:hypothetical protein